MQPLDMTSFIDVTVVALDQQIRSVFHLARDGERWLFLWAPSIVGDDTKCEQSHPAL